MALITSRTNLSTTEVTLDTSAKTITLNIAGNLSTDGVTLKALYSYLKYTWKNTTGQTAYAFPMTPITDYQYELFNGWDFASDNTRNLVRSGGWAVKDVSGVSMTEYTNVTTLGTIDTSGSNGQVYYQQVSGGSTSNFVLLGRVNQAVKTYGDLTHGNIDYRNYMQLFVRDRALTYSSATLTDIGETSVTYTKYAFPLYDAVDSNISATDNDIDTTAPYTGMSITWYGSNQSFAMSGGTYNFRVVINANGGTAKQVYEYCQRQLRLNSDIDAGAGTKTGKITAQLCHFEGNDLYTDQDDDGYGVYIDNIAGTSVNVLHLVDNTGTYRMFPFLASLTLQMGTNLINDADSYYRVYFTNDDAGDNLGYDFGTSNAIVVNTGTSFSTTHREVTSNVATITTSEAHGLVAGDGVNITNMTDGTYDGFRVVISAPTTTTFTYALTHLDEVSTADTAGTVTVAMAGLVSGSSSIALTFDYDANLQRGTGSNGTDAPVTAVAGGLSTAQYVLNTGTMERSSTNSVALVAALERNYSA